MQILGSRLSRRHGRDPENGAGQSAARAAAGYGAALALIVYTTTAAGLERPPGFVALAGISPTIRQDMRYAGTNNFTGRPVPGYGAAECWLRHDAAEALAKVQASLRTTGLGLIVYDCYRPLRATSAFLRWAADPSDTLQKNNFYPNIDKATLFRRGYIAERSAHSTGLAVDLALVDRQTGVQLDFGTPFDHFDPRSATEDPGVSAPARANRRRLVAAMAASGFANLKGEWWHFALAGAAAAKAWDIPIR